MNSRFGHVTYTMLGIRHATLKSVCRDFNIEILLNFNLSTSRGIGKDSILDSNFVYFLIENKTFIRMYELDYYSNKTIEIIANKIGRKEDEIEEYLQLQKYQVDTRYPFRYLSSYKIDYLLGGRYDFLKYDHAELYEGNYEFRRKTMER